MKRFLDSPVTATLILINIGIWLLAEKTGSTKETATLIRWGASNQQLVWDGQAWRLLTSVFLHIGIIHLVWNAYAGFSWCARAEATLGKGWFLVVYLLTGVGGSALSVIGHDVVSAGASGSLFGMIGVELTLLYRRAGTFAVFRKDPAVRNHLITIAVWFVIGMTALAMDNWAHAGGLVCGVLLALALTTKDRNPMAIGGAIAAVAVLVLLALRPLPVVHRASEVLRDAKGASARGDHAEVLRITEGTTAPKVMRVRLDAFVGLKQFTEVEALATTLMALEPKDPGHPFLRGSARLERKNFTGALEDLGVALALAPTHAWSYYLRAQAHRGLGDLKKAEADLTRALEHQPKFCEAAWLRAMVVEGLDAQLEDWGRAIAHCPDPTQPLIARAGTLLDAGRLDDARKDVEALLQRAPANATGHGLLCALEEQAGRPAEAEAACSQALALDATQPEARKLRARIRLERAEYAGALADFDEVLKLEPTNPFTLVGRGGARRGLGDRDGALKDADAAIATDPEAWGAHALRIAVRLEKGDARGAREDCVWVAEHAPAERVELHAMCKPLAGK